MTRVATDPACRVETRPAGGSVGRHSCRHPTVGVGLLLCLLGLAATTSSAAVFGEDDRRKLTPEEPTYAVHEALGRLTCRHPETGQKLVGTAAIVDTGTAEDGHEILLTAAHVVMDPATGKPLDDCRFKIAGRFWGSDPVIGIRHGEFDGRPHTNAEDWAVVVIATSQPAPTRLPIWRPSDTPGPVALLGYRGDRGGLWVSDGCFARAPQPGEALHGEQVWLSDCDASPGSSGAPLLVMHEGRWHWAGAYRGHLYQPSIHEDTPTRHPVFSGRSAMNVMVIVPTRQ